MVDFVFTPHLLYIQQLMEVMKMKRNEYGLHIIIANFSFVFVSRAAPEILSVTCRVRRLLLKYSLNPFQSFNSYTNDKEATKYIFNLKSFTNFMWKQKPTFGHRMEKPNRKFCGKTDFVVKSTSAPSGRTKLF